MDFTHVIRAIGLSVQAGVPVLLEGTVGDGKTSIVESLFGRLCAKHHTSIVALHEPPEYGGYPVPREATREQPAGVRLLPVGWVADLARVEEGKRAGLFLDEFSNGAPATRSATMRGVLDGTWGETHIPRLSTVVAMNPPEMAESGYELSAPLSNRFCHIDWDMPPSYWLEQFVAGFPAPDYTHLPEDWESRLPWAKTMVAAYGMRLPGSLKQVPAGAAERSKPFPTLRSWTMASKLLAACKAAGYGLEHDVTVLLIAGCVGQGAAHEFLTYAAELDLPDPETLLKNPNSLRLPERGDRAFAVLTAVVSAVVAKNTPQRWNAAWAVLAKAVEGGRPDVAAGSARVLAAVRPSKEARLPKEIDALIPVLKTAGLLQP